MSYREKLPSTQAGTVISNSAVIGNLVDTDGTDNVFETDQALGDTPTLSIDLSCTSEHKIRKFRLESINYYMNPTAAETYTLYLFEDASADNVQNLADLVFQSPAAQADSTLYWYRSGAYGTPPGIGTVDFTIPSIVSLGVPNKIYYLLDWTGAPGNTPGFITVRGRLLY
jgi:hypothetical protein